jgi:hypothetical protein
MRVGELASQAARGSAMKPGPVAASTQTNQRVSPRALHQFITGTPW